MLVGLKTILADTREKHYAVGLFNCVTLEMTKGILAAAEELHSPVIIGPPTFCPALRRGICRHDAGHGPPRRYCRCAAL